MKRIQLLKIVLLPLLLSGCADIARQNIISSVNTGIGLTVAQNPQSQLYEVKVGYIRSQFYSIPTGKTFDKDGNPIATDADKAPQLVAGIRMHSGVDNLLVGMDVSENFAVGDIAVMSPAAVAMYIANAQSDKKADAAAAATGYASLKDPGLLDNQRKLDDLLKKKLKPNTSLDGKTFQEGQTRDFADSLAEKKGATLKTVRRMGGKDLEEIISQLKTQTAD